MMPAARSPDKNPGEGEVAPGSGGASTPGNIISPRPSGSSGLVKAGFGTLALTGANTYTGDTYIVQGTLAVGSNQSLGLGANIQFLGAEFSVPEQWSTLASGNLTTSKNLIGTYIRLDTAGTMSLSGSIAPGAQILKVGDGTLSLSTPAIQSVTVQSGTLALHGVSSGAVALSAGTLDASGRLDSFYAGNSFALAVASGTIGRLTIASLDVTYSVPLKLELSADQSDYLRVDAFSSNVPNFVVNFADLGGAETGVDYTIFGSDSGSISPLAFSLSSANLAAGWQAVFRQSGDEIVVNFAQIPEPTSAALLTTSGLFFLGCGLRRRGVSRCA